MKVLATHWSHFSLCDTMFGSELWYLYRAHIPDPVSKSILCRFPVPVMSNIKRVFEMTSHSLCSHAHSVWLQWTSHIHGIQWIKFTILYGSRVLSQDLPGASTATRRRQRLILRESFLTEPLTWRINSDAAPLRRREHKRFAIEKQKSMTETAHWIKYIKRVMHANELQSEERNLMSNLTAKVSLK